jgi:hypothetical protein
MSAMDRRRFSRSSAASSRLMPTRGYDGLYQSGRVIEVGCWAHGRRRFVEAFMTDTSAALMIALL